MKKKKLTTRQMAQRRRRIQERQEKQRAFWKEPVRAAFDSASLNAEFDAMAHPTAQGGHPRFHEIVQKMSDLHDKKNTDYAAGTVEGPLGNFERCSKIMHLYPGMDWASPFGVAMAFMLKQFDAGLTLKAQKRASVTGEPVAARLTDIAVYTVLGIILDEAENAAKETKAE